MSATAEDTETKPAKAKKPKAKKAVVAKPNKPKLETLTIANIDTSVCESVRAAINEDRVDIYAETEGELPPIDVFRGPGFDYAGDGGHRIMARLKKEAKSIPAMVRTYKTDEEALDAAKRHAYGPANARHGLARTVADLRASITAALLDYGYESDHGIARIVQCHRSRIRQIRIDLTRAGKLAGKAAATYADMDKPKTEEVPTTGRAASQPTPTPSANGKAPPKEDQEWMNEGAEGAQVVDSGDDVGDTAMVEPLPEVLASASTDEKGRHVPNALAPAFLARTRFRSIIGSAGRLMADVTELACQWVGEGIPLNPVKISMEEFTGNISAAMPFVVCPSCEGDEEMAKGCKCCAKRGWLTRLRFQQLTPDLQAKAEGPWKN